MGARPVHVELAVKMAAAGYEIAEGVRVEYVIVDGRSPLKAVAAHDFNGEFDRYYLWENLVYPPSQRVLEVAIGGHKWKDYLRLRPTKSGKVRPDNLSVALAALSVHDAIATNETTNNEQVCKSERGDGCPQRRTRTRTGRRIEAKDAAGDVGSS
jgi:hypothetical protein